MERERESNAGIKDSAFFFFCLLFFVFFFILAHDGNCIEFAGYHKIR